MKVQKIIKGMYRAIIAGDRDEEKRLWFKALRKSIKHTHAIR